MKKKAYTIVELLVVVVVLGVILSVAIYKYQGAVRKSDPVVCKNNMKVLEAAIINARLNGIIIPENYQYLGAFKEVLEKEIKNNKFPICPESGYYYLKNDTVYCSKHGTYLGEEGLPDLPDTNNDDSDDTDDVDDTDETENE